MPILEVKNLETTFFLKASALRAVDNVSFSLNEARTLGVLGESGCGKSVTSYSIMRLITPPGKITGGDILLGDKDLLSLSEKEMERVRGRELAMIFQEPMTALNPVLKIGYQMCEQLHAHTSLSKNEAKEKAVEGLNQVGIPSPSECFGKFPHQLSGGMRQRAMIAMALLCGPQVLIADEPTTALDVTIQAQILDLIQSEQEKMKMSVMFITHDLGVISEISDDVLVMYAGRMCEYASLRDVFSSPFHPYTRALLDSIPRFRGGQRRLPVIPGQVPTLTNLSQGCYFSNRCQYTKEICTKKSPPWREISNGHFAACFLDFKEEKK